MTKIISAEQTENLLRKYLIGSCVNSVTYFVTGWKLRFLGQSGFECLLHASDIVVPDLQSWQSALVMLPLNILDTNEPDDVIAAAIIFSAVNRWPVEGLRIDPDGNMSLRFENGAEFRVEAHVEHVDWTWSVDRENGQNIVLCDSGTLNLNE